jgi:hypothetical protein
MTASPLRSASPPRAKAPKKPKKPAVRLTDEHHEQCMLFAWADVAKARTPELWLLHAIPNYARVSARWGAWMKAEGKKAGVPDIHLPVPRGRFASLYIELKVKPNRVSPEQIAWHERLWKAGNCARVCWSWIEAREVIESYLSLHPIPEHP